MNVDPLTESPIEHRPRAPGYWIRRYLPDKDAFVLAPVDGEGAEFVATLDPQSPTRGRARETIMAALFGPRRSLASVRLLVHDRTRRRATDTEPKDAIKILNITDAFQTRLIPDAEARKILDAEGRVISRWSDALEDAVDHHGRIWLAQRALDFFAMIDAAIFAEIRDCATANLSPQAKAALPDTFESMLGGPESARHCRYNPNLPLRLQLAGPPDKSQQANYSLQRAVIDALAVRMTAHGSALADAQAALQESRGLVAVPPSRSSMLLRTQTTEAARGIGAQLLAGLMELNRAAPATQEFDELWTPKADGGFVRRPALHDEIVREMAPHPVAQSADMAEKIHAYLALGSARMARYEAEARQLVVAEQAKTATPATPPHPRTAPEYALPITPPGEAPPRLKRFVKASEPAANALDHAHKAAAETETVPWF